ncbi:uncharacterized protein LOC124364433 [Homalodisca vitripennis]|uniref:uncharacterized protein LOC124364433 n=1 Tax=Homalodisca vitripennis TaxID=197043 RepID=UPI001EEA8163|nr:uncharacterized protein LOC124364433 [Homalodisca vitripennis]
MVESVVKGTKSSRIAVSETGGVQEEASTEDMSQSDCLSEAEIVALARVGLTLEQLFGWPRDMETTHKGVIYLLQCRPVTSLLTWSQDELMHELDSAILPNDATTTANTGEVLPRETSHSVSLAICAVYRGVYHPLWYNNSRISTSHQHVLLNIYNTILKLAEQKPTRYLLRTTT